MIVTGADNLKFPAEERLKDRACIKSAFKKGVRVGCEGFGLFFLPNGLTHNRFLCTFKRGYGSAVERNRARRLSKEAYRLIKSRLKTGYDFILLVFSKRMNFAACLDKMIYLFKAAKIYNEVL